MDTPTIVSRALNIEALLTGRYLLERGISLEDAVKGRPAAQIARLTAAYAEALAERNEAESDLRAAEAATREQADKEARAAAFIAQQTAAGLVWTGPQPFTIDQTDAGLWRPAREVAQAKFDAKWNATRPANLEQDSPVYQTWVADRAAAASAAGLT